MNKPRGESEQTKLLLLKTATELFAKKGYQATTLSEICASAGVSKGSIYFHFRSKEELFIGVLEHDRETSVERWERAYAALTAKASTREICVEMAKYYAEDYRSPLLQASKEFSMQGVLDGAMLERVLELSRWHHPLIRKILERGMERGEIRRQDPAELTLLIASMLDGLDTLIFSVGMDTLMNLHEKAVLILLDGVALGSR